MSNEERHVEREVRGGPAYVQREEIRDTGQVHVIRESNAAAWWIAALVAIVALVAVLWMFSSNQQQVADIEAAREAGRAEAMTDLAAAQAQSAAIAAAEASRTTTDSLARATEAAAADAAAASREAAEEAQQAAASVADAAHDAADASIAVPDEPLE